MAPKTATVTVKTLTVRVKPSRDKALAGKLHVAKEGTNNRFHFESDGDFEVPANAYYLRKIHRGELELATKKGSK